MPSSTRIQILKFLLDENVPRKLFHFLKGKGFDVKLAAKSASDDSLALLSKTEGRIFVTNDEDFTDYSDEEIFALIWLRVPQGDVDSLLTSFEKLLKEFKKFSGRLVVLEKDKWSDFPLIQKITVKGD